MKNCIVIIPVREFANTKLRLRSVLSKRQRANLTSSLLLKVLSQVEKSHALGAIIVASSPDLVRKRVRGFSKVLVIRESRHHGGVNSAMQDGLKYIGKEHHDAAIILIPSDLPLLTFKALDNIIHLLEKYDLLINPSSKLDGTSLLAFNLGLGQIPFHYDDDSFRKHSAEMKKLKIKHLILRMREFSFDVDSDRDLGTLCKTLKASSFRELLVKLEDGIRV